MSRPASHVMRRCRPALRWAELLLLVIVLGWTPAVDGGTSTNFIHEAYVWQRAWTAPVRHAVQEHGTNFHQLVALAAEVSWADRSPRVVRIGLDYATLAQAGCRIGLALRVGPYPGPFETNNAAASLLSKLAASLLAEARSNNVAPQELQLDFDCAEAKLAGYRKWVEAVRRQIAPTPLVITTLPSWLKQPALEELLNSADGYVLQVHSLERPRNASTPFSLCDPVMARKAVEQAGRMGLPFRVALPTYGYLAAFDPQGRLAGISAEGPLPSWPATYLLREVESQPLEIAFLLQYWSTNRPPELHGVLWYRLPVVVDNLNWRWPTLRAMVAARTPRESVRGRSRRVEPGLVEISLENDGELDISSRLAIEVRWQRARLVASDGLGGFEPVGEDPSTVIFQNRSPPRRLPAGEQLVIGWLRLSADREVELELRKLSSAVGDGRTQDGSSSSSSKFKP